MIKKIFILLSLLFTSSSVFAGVSGKDCGTEGLFVRIDATVHSDDETSLCIDKAHNQFLSVNGVGIPFEEVGFAYQYCTSGGQKPGGYQYDACIPKSIVKVTGDNLFQFGICNGFEGGISCTSNAMVNQESLVYIVTAGGRSVPLFRLARVGEGATYSGKCRTGSGTISETGSCLGNIRSEDIIPEIVQEIANISGQVSQLQNQGRQLSQAEKNKFDALDKALQAIQNKSFDKLTVDDLAAFQEARDILLDGKKQSGELLAAINSKIEEIRKRLTQIKADVSNQLGDLGVDLQNDDSYKDSISFEIPPVNFGALPAEDTFDEKDSIFWILDNSTVASLSDSWTKGDRRRFLETVAAWADKNDSLYVRYSAMLLASAKKQQAYINANQYMDGFLYGTADGKGYLNRNMWFKDSPVAPELISAIEDLLAKDANDPFAQKLKKALITYSGQLDQKQTSLIGFTYTMVKFFDAYRAAYEAAIANGGVLGSSAKPNDLWLVSAKANLENMKQEVLNSVQWGVDTYIATSPASPVFSLCELITHRKHCDFNNPRESYSFLDNFGRVIDAVPAMAIVPIVKSMKGLNLAQYKIFDVAAEEPLDVISEADRIGAIEKSAKITQDLIKKSPALADPRTGVRVLLSYFHDGASFIIPQAAYENLILGKPVTHLFGYPDGLFISTPEAIRGILKESGGSKAFIKQKLSIKPADWPGDLYLVEVASPLEYNIRLPSGFETGANDQFKWGGFTKGGIPEAVTDSIPISRLKITKLDVQ